MSHVQLIHAATLHFDEVSRLKYLMFIWSTPFDMAFWVRAMNENSTEVYILRQCCCSAHTSLVSYVSLPSHTMSMIILCILVGVQYHTNLAINAQNFVLIGHMHVHYASQQCIAIFYSYLYAQF